MALVVHRHTAAARKAELSSGEIDDIRVGADGARDFANAPIPAGGLAHLDEVQIVLHQARVQHDHDAVFMGDLRRRGHVFQ
ncbi:hypothetical protein SDC9_152717 [bioreactor metagenome]|uniref:Uncharacterized protein n=1 Tax=bioreactor metagenome TaxID=1076179 RepID=A0A645EUE0_9ZZZZ